LLLFFLPVNVVDVNVELGTFFVFIALRRLRSVDA